MKIVFPHYTGARSLYIQEGRRDKGRKTAPPPSRCSGTQSCPDATSGPSSPDAHYSDMQLQPRVAPVVTALLPSTRRAGAASSVSDSYNCSGREAGSAHGDHQRGTVDGEGVNCLGRWAGLITMEGESQKRRSASARHPLPRGDMRSPPRSLPPLCSSEPPSPLRRSAKRWSARQARSLFSRGSVVSMAM